MQLENDDNKDIGFVKAGAPVKVRVNSFPFTEYGEIPGIVERVGENTTNTTL